MSTGNNIETEYLDFNNRNTWGVYYEQIRAESSRLYNHQCKESMKPQNKILNRYRDVSPYDHSRIVLQKGPSDYINANLIKVEKANRQYILTQGPLPCTVGHFWLMVWEQKSKAVLMLNKLIEKSREKCYQYWPRKIGPDHVMNLEDVGLTVEYLEQQDYSYFITRILRLTETESGESRLIYQFHYTTWPDFSVPCSPTAFLEFLRQVRAAKALEADVGPAIVHCSAGIGRSGTFCLVDSCLVLIEKFGINSVDVKEILLEMRRYRMGLIQTPEQLRFSYEAIIEGAKQLANPPSNNEINNSIIKTSNGTSKSNDESSSEEENGEEDDEPPPLPPPRFDSLHRDLNGPPIDRPLPTIPVSTSLTEFTCEDSDSIEENHNPPSGPLPVVPADGEPSSEDELEVEDEATLSSIESPVSESNDLSNSKSPTSPTSELRQRQRADRKSKMEALVRDIKRRQQTNEQWTQLKRSLLKPIIIGSLAVGGGLLVYFYWKY